MAQISESVKNARLNAIETIIGTAPLLRIYDGSLPADCASPASGNLLVEITLPSDWLQAADGGSIVGNTSWVGTADATIPAGGYTATYFRIYTSAGVDCHIQGSVSQTGFGGDLTFEDILFLPSQDVVVATFALSEPAG